MGTLSNISYQWERGLTPTLPTGSWRHWFSAIFILALTMTAGCHKPPSSYKMKPYELERVRSSIETVGVIYHQYQAEKELSLPAKGVSEAGTRGFIAGASITIGIGFLAPVPGGSAIGAMLSPVGGAIGYFTGITRAQPEEKVERVEMELQKAADTIQSRGLLKTFSDDLMMYAESNTNKQFVLYGNQGPTHVEDFPTYTPVDYPGIDAILEVRPVSFGLWALWTVNPTTYPTAVARVRLIRLNSNEVIFDDVITSSGDAQSYEVWAEGSELFVQEIKSCFSKLVEKIIDDVFLVTPIIEPRR